MRVATIKSALLLVLLFSAQAGAIEIEQACDAAAARAERNSGVPAGVLAAVGTVESGRGHGPWGAAPWPWTINAAGRGSHYGTKSDAIAAVFALMARGYPMIDIGCFQIDILYHAGVFRSLDEAFDPERNAEEAARILVAEHARGAEWATAVARYHSANPEQGRPYLERVRAALSASRVRANTAALVRNFGDGAGAATNTALPRVIYALPITAEMSAPPNRSKRRELPVNRAVPQLLPPGATGDVAVMQHLANR